MKVVTTRNTIRLALAMVADIQGEGNHVGLMLNDCVLEDNEINNAVDMVERLTEFSSVQAWESLREIW